MKYIYLILLFIQTSDAHQQNIQICAKVTEFCHLLCSGDFQSHKNSAFFNALLSFIIMNIYLSRQKNKHMECQVFLNILFIYLAAPALGCGTQEFSLQPVNSQLQHLIWFLDQQSNLGPLPQECRILATGPPGSPKCQFKCVTYHFQTSCICFEYLDVIYGPVFVLLPQTPPTSGISRSILQHMSIKSQ